MFRERFSHSSPPTPVFCSDHKQRFHLLYYGMSWGGLGWGGGLESQLESLRGPALVAPWILEVSYSVVSLALGQQLIWVAGMFI